MLLTLMMLLPAGQPPRKTTTGPLLLPDAPWHVAQATVQAEGEKVQ